MTEQIKSGPMAPPRRTARPGQTTVSPRKVNYGGRDSGSPGPRSIRSRPAASFDRRASRRALWDRPLQPLPLLSSPSSSLPPFKSLLTLIRLYSFIKLSDTVALFLDLGYKAIFGPPNVPIMPILFSPIARREDRPPVDLSDLKRRKKRDYDVNDKMVEGLLGSFPQKVLHHAGRVLPADVPAVVPRLLPASAADLQVLALAAGPFEVGPDIPQGQ
jgi:hypothetical protein